MLYELLHFFRCYFQRCLCANRGFCDPDDHLVFVQVVLARKHFFLQKCWVMPTAVYRLYTTHKFVDVKHCRTDQNSPINTSNHFKHFLRIFLLEFIWIKRHVSLRPAQKHFVSFSDLDFMCFCGLHNKPVFFYRFRWTTKKHFIFVHK